jgi:hypothetical protein
MGVCVFVFLCERDRFVVSKSLHRPANECYFCNLVATELELLEKKSEFVRPPDNFESL